MALQCAARIQSFGNRFNPSLFTCAVLMTTMLGCSENNLHLMEKGNPGVGEPDAGYGETSAGTTVPTDESTPDYEGSADLLVGCDGDTAPIFVEHAPANDSVIDNQDLLIEVWAQDDRTDLSELQFRWYDENGVQLQANTADNHGYAALQWDGERPAGLFGLSVEVEDECGNVTHLDLDLCQQEGYEQQEMDIASWNLEGSAHILSNGELELTGLNTFMVGSAFMIAQPVWAGDVTIRFQYKTEGGTGADGISLTALDIDRMTSFLGGDGCGIGYGGETACTDGPGLPGWSIELDSWYNAELPDPTPLDHVAFSFDGQVASPEVWAPVAELEETGWHTVEISVQAPRVQIVIDGCLYIDQDIQGNFDFPAYIGFTGSTGGQTNNHRIRALTVTEHVCEVAEEEVEPEYECPDLSDQVCTPDEAQITPQVTSDWGSGYCMEFIIHNPCDGPLVWHAEHPVDGTINSLWNATTQTTGNTWKFTGETWNTSILSGDQTSFGFCADR